MGTNLYLGMGLNLYRYASVGIGLNLYPSVGMGLSLYPSVRMGFLMGIIFLYVHGYGFVVSSGYVSVAILRCSRGSGLGCH